MPRLVKGKGGRASTMAASLGESGGGGSGSGASVLANGFGDNAAIVAIDNAIPTPLATVTVTPRVSGKFSLAASVVGINADDTLHTAQISFSHTSTPEYPASPNSVGIARASVNPSASLALVAESGSAAYPFTAPIGSPVTFTLLGLASAKNQITVPAHGAQLTVVELPN